MTKPTKVNLNISNIKNIFTHQNSVWVITSTDQIYACGSNFNESLGINRNNNINIFEKLDFEKNDDEKNEEYILI